MAAATIHEWEAAREIGGTAFVLPISEALQKYFDDAEARHLASIKVTELPNPR